MPRLTAIFAVLCLAAGCSSAPSTPGMDPDVEEALSDMQDSKREYEICVHDQEEEPELPCDTFKEIYEEDKDAYERLLVQKGGKPH
jgi:hypothetical protein